MKHPNPSLRTCRRHQGFSLIEVLVSLLILAIGVLGVVGVQISSVKFNLVSQQRSYATQHAVSMAERMRSNLAAFAGGSADTYVYNHAYKDLQDKKPAAPDCTSSCTAEKLAQKHINQWQTELAAALPDGRGSIRQLEKSKIGSPFVITVMWTEKELTNSGKLLRSPSCDDKGLTEPLPPAEVQCLAIGFQP
jgi:type IV pilus assembly protein PilV